jgi:hypothetical protein
MTHVGTGWNIGVLSVAHELETLRSALHTHIISSVAEIESMWG